MANAHDSEVLSLERIADYHNDATEALQLFFGTLPIRVEARYVGYTQAELQVLLTSRIRETELRSSLAILSTIEAAFRIDYRARCARRLKDSLSRHFRNKDKTHGRRVSFEEHILSSWASHQSTSKTLIGELRGAFKYRHWLAHGRYGSPKLGRNYDYLGIYLLAELVFLNLRFEAEAS